MGGKNSDHTHREWYPLFQNLWETTLSFFCDSPSGHKIHYEKGELAFLNTYHTNGTDHNLDNRFLACLACNYSDDGNPYQGLHCHDIHPDYLGPYSTCYHNIRCNYFLGALQQAVVLELELRGRKVVPLVSDSVPYFAPPLGHQCVGGLQASVVPLCHSLQ